jgi:cardiolipin synthase A/B
MNPQITETLPQTLGLGTILHILSVLVLVVHILRRPGDSRTSLLWILFASVFPLFGISAYVLFGINTASHKGWEKHHSDIRFNNILYNFRTPAQATDKPYRHDSSSAISPEAKHLNTLNRMFDQTAHPHPLLDGNKVELLDNAEMALETMFSAIANARRHINLSTYILHDDCIGQRLMFALKDCAERGIKVRIMYDAFGSAVSNLRLFFLRYRKIPNLKLIGFSQVNVLKRSFQLNNRNHRKLLIIDSRIAFTGGVNFHDVYLAKGSKAGTLDYHFSIRGPTVLELQHTFLRDWYYMTGEDPSELLCDDYFPVPEICGKSAIRLINSGPTQDEKAFALDTLVATVNLAQKQVIILTPYFVPPNSLILALRLAALRGVDIRILVPRENNHPTLRQASHALYEPLLLSGVRIFERNPPFIHAKATLIDDEAAIIGSANLDPRSLFLNYETNLFVFDRQFTMTLKQSILAEFNESVEITHLEWNKRSGAKRFIENFFNLFHPIA